MALTEKLPSNWFRVGDGRKVKETTNGVHIGALVSIDSNSSWWTGAKVEKWWHSRKWYISGLEGNKAMLGCDETGRYSAWKEISTNFLTVVEEAKEGAPDGGI